MKPTMLRLRFLVAFAIGALIESKVYDSQWPRRQWHPPNDSSSASCDRVHDETRPQPTHTQRPNVAQSIPRGGGLLAGWNPMGYKITPLGEQFMAFEGSADSDLGRFLASLKQRKRVKVLKDQWLEVVRVAKTGQSMRIYRKLDDLIKFCLDAGFID